MSDARPASPALSARLTVTAGAGREAFTVESELSLERGLLVLFGPSGAGKSLTLQALAGLMARATLDANSPFAGNADSYQPRSAHGNAAI